MVLGSWHSHFKPFHNGVCISSNQQVRNYKSLSGGKIKNLDPKTWIFFFPSMCFCTGKLLNLVKKKKRLLKRIKQPLKSYFWYRKLKIFSLENQKEKGTHGFYIQCHGLGIHRIMYVYVSISCFFNFFLEGRGRIRHL
jgi:hypothetical protein